MTYSSLINQIFPLKRINIRDKRPVPFFNEKLKQMRENLQVLNSISAARGRPEHHNASKVYKKQYQSAIQNAKIISLMNQVTNPRTLGS